jgi:membrane-associated PAP2 superfamily phosphatase
MQDQKKIFLYQSTLLLLSLLILIVVFPIGGSIDMKLISPWMTPSGQFYLTENWYLAKLSHSYVKTLIIVFYSVIFFAWLGSFKFQFLKTRRFELGFLFFVSMLCTISIGILKAHSPHACPWNMTIPTDNGFIWDFSSENGHCFPGGHASSGFALITGYFVYRLSHPKIAYLYLSIGIILGFAMGWTQMMRGAHFLSHNLWTLWIIFFINVVVYTAIQWGHLIYLKKEKL